jgi:hypothetical protein
MEIRVALACLAMAPGLLFGQALNVPWSGYGHDPQHTAISANASQPLSHVHWSTPVDLNTPQGELFIHYGSSIVTAANTVIVPVKTGATDGFEIRAFSGASGTPLYTITSDYTSPAHNWIPPYGPVLSLRNRIYFPGPGGTLYYRDSVDSATGVKGQIAFYGTTLYIGKNKATFDSNVKICTPLTSDRFGTIYFGFIVTGTNAANLTSGIARVTINGGGSWAPVTAFGLNDANMSQLATNAAPTLSNDQRTVYAAVSQGGEFGYGYVAALDSTSFLPLGHVELMDPQGGTATVSSDSSASPMVGPDGDVYFGVLENNCCGSHNFRGWMLHFDSTLAHTKLPGSFGWDDTASVVPSSLVASYTGTSPYLILTKYNNYVGEGTGNGVNKVAILDPGAPMQDLYSASNTMVMKEIITIAGVTPDPHNGFPNAVREWCINTAVIDPFTKSALVNSEDGVLYRWDFTTNSFTQRIVLTGGIGEAYTPTTIGVDGTVYAINDAILFAVGN